MNEVVKYHNNLSQLPLKDFKGSELDILMSLCSKCKYKETQKLKFSFSELKAISNYNDKNDKHFIADLEQTNKKLMGLNMRLENEKKIIQFVLFPYFEIDKEEKTLSVKVNQDFAYLLNSLTNNFTRFELEEFVELKSCYAKSCYRQLKRFRDTGWWKVSVADFRSLMDIPKSYSNAEMTRKVLKPIEEELSPLFKDFTVDTQRGTGRGRPIQFIIFNWTEEPRYKDIQIEEEENDPKKTTPSYKKTGFICPNCGKELYEKVINNEVIWCHKDGWKEDSECKMIYRSVADIEGYKEAPTREDKTYKEEVKEEHKGFFKRLFSR